MAGNHRGPSFDSEVLDALPAHIAVLDRDGVVRTVNEAWARFSNMNALPGGVDVEQLSVGKNYVEVCRGAGTDPRAMAAAEGITSVLEGRQARFELEYPCDGPDEPRWFVMTVTPLHSGGALVAHVDVTARKQAEHAVMAQNGVLALIASGARLEDVLNEIAQLVEAQIPGARCEVRLREGDMLCLRAAPSTHPDYRQQVERIPIGPDVGSCGTAAFRGQLVVVEDVATDPLWEKYRALALRYGMRAAWSFPIHAGGSRGEFLGASVRLNRTPPHGNKSVPQVADDLLGTFAIYLGRPAAPSQRELGLMSHAAHLVSIGIERARVLGELAESEERFRLLIDGIPDAAVFMVDLLGRIATWNAAAKRTYGYEASEAIGLPASKLEVPDSGEQALDGSPDGGPPLGGPEIPQGRESECWQLRKGGERFFATVVTTAMRNADGTLRGHAKVVRDVTKRRELEEQLRHAQKMEAVGRLAGGIAHDFNNLLTVIKANLDVLDAEVAVKPNLVESMSEIVVATDRASGLTRQLLAFSRKQVLDPVVLDLNHVVVQCEKLLRRLIGEHITLESHLGNHVRSIKADAGQIEQVLINLCVNARDAMPHGGTLRFATRNVPRGPTESSGRQVELIVSDTGIGMDEATKARVFEPFFTTKPHGQGTGLGLAVVYGIVQQSGGQIQVESAPGRGTTFRIQLPAVASESVAVSPSEHPPAVRGRERLLLVEDEDLVRRSLVRALTRHGYDVLEASGAGAALDELQHAESRIDLMVTDVVMPGMSGPKLVEVVRRILPDLRVLYISGYTDDLVTLGADDTHAFLQKPFSPASLLEKVRAVLDTPLT